MQASWDKNKEVQRHGEHHMLNHKLCEHMKEELEDIMEYHRLSEEAKEAGHEEVSEWLMRIAKDEYSHAKYLHEHLKKVGYPIPDEQEVEAKFYKIKQL